MQKTGGIVFGALLVLLGAVWVGQGLGYIRGSFMTGQIRWFWIGLAAAVIGLALLGLSIQGRRRAG